LQVYSTYDDGIEMFGGNFQINNFVGLYVRDDTLDLDEGWIGTINNALIIQSETDGNHCIESDGIGSFEDLDAATVEDFITRGLNTRVTINNLTCIFSPNGAATATHDPGAGFRFREGIFVTLNDSMVVGSFVANDAAATDDNFCLRIDDRSGQAALDGDLVLNNVIYSCAERTTGQTLAGGTVTEEQFATDSGNIFATVPSGTAVSATAVNNPELQLLEGAPPIYSIAYATSQVDGVVPGAGSDPTPGLYLGALSLGETDWTAGWTFGLHADSQSQPLWFEDL
ncbi:MAG: serine/threonine protein kinase, partial [Woeseiaceae bacterium]